LSAASPLQRHTRPLFDSLDVDGNRNRGTGHRMCVMRVSLPRWKEIPDTWGHSAQIGYLSHARRVQACGDQARGVELVENTLRRALRLGSEVNHGARAALEAI